LLHFVKTVFLIGGRGVISGQWQATSEKTQPFQSGNCDFACLLQCLLANINIVFLFSVVSAGIYLKKGFFCQFEMFAPERANRDGEGEKSLC